jgi:beta-phosphoglucomutase-like phosphatase (HAD superfamily)
MHKFLLWDQDGVLVDTERWFFVATQECLRELGVELNQATYLQYMAAFPGTMLPAIAADPTSALYSLLWLHESP